ncbi:hypothetical protein CASFOL_016300 [Castilleja foliolosa]|uniref:IMS import disulfide relay-system CHCH-CHCH-like Cx9C domain-containing protein n=1 Tax=Castilleja foliolosa TaxID=1961234 RepID=A0ABD3DI35_9LAMI
MGRKAGTLYINPKKFGNLQKPCMREMISFLNCLALSQQGTDAKCTRQKSMLSTCMDAQAAVKESLGVALTITCRGLAREENRLISPYGLGSFRSKEIVVKYFRLILHYVLDFCGCRIKPLNEKLFVSS